MNALTLGRQNLHDWVWWVRDEWKKQKGRCGYGWNETQGNGEMVKEEWEKRVRCGMVENWIMSG